MKINKKLLAMMMTLAIGGALVGCTNNTEQPAVPPTEVETPVENTEQVPVEGEVSSLANEVTVITEGMEMPGLVPMPEEMFNDTYGIDTSLLKNYYVGMPMMNVHATEIAIFELNNEADVDTVMAGIEKRQKALEEQWKTYLPDQYELVQNYKTAVNGNKVLFVISDQADAIVENFNAAK